MRPLLACVTCLALAACRTAPVSSSVRAADPVATRGDASPPAMAAVVDAAEDPAAASRPPPAPELEARLRARARAVLAALAARDMNALAAIAEPARGVRFSPYSYVDTKADVVLSPAELRGALQRAKVRTWGTEDGRGDPIALTFAGYYRSFVWTRDFRRAPALTVDRGEATGNTEDNLTEAYPLPSEHFVEAFLEASEKFGGMDWQSLRLVFVEEPADGGGGSVTTLHLVGIVHGQWTI